MTSANPDHRPNIDKRDCIVLWPTMMLLGIPGFHIFMRTTSAASDLAYVLIGMTTLEAIWIGTAVWSVALSIRALRARAWRRALSCGVIPLLAVGCIGSLGELRTMANRLGDRLHFELNYDDYAARVRRGWSDQPRLLVFSRGGMIWASMAVVYDESDEILLPEGQQSDAWRTRAQGTDLACRGFFALPLRDHFYSVSFPC